MTIYFMQVHIVTGGLACICLALGVMFQLSASHLWRSVFRSNFHTYSGILAFCLFCSEIVIGCFMKRTLDVKKPILNWLHTVMGHFAYNISRKSKLPEKFVQPKKNYSSYQYKCHIILVLCSIEYDIFGSRCFWISRL